MPIKILFIGYDEKKTTLISKLREKGCLVDHTSAPLGPNCNRYDLLVSFGYRHIIKKEMLCLIHVPIVNLHIAYLPYNRGAHPHFWSFFDGTPSGVTIHLIDEGIDTGPILYQKRVNFEKRKATFKKTYRRLIKEMEDLFMGNIDEIISRQFVPRKQSGKGTYHNTWDLPANIQNWDVDIDQTICNLLTNDEKQT